MEDRSLRRLLVFRSITPVHAGAGPEAMSAIDLPIQRERHTGWPTIYGSSVKGALRSYYLHLKGKDLTRKVFGSEPGEEEKETGAISFSDMRLLLFPVKSYQKVFLWITCPEALERLVFDLKHVVKDEGSLKKLKEKVEDIKNSLNPSEKGENIKALSPSYSGGIYIEDVKIPVENEELKEIIELISNLTGIKGKELNERMIIVQDSIFSNFVRNRTFVVPRIRLNPRTKVNERNALWYEEYLPPECVLYSLVLETIALDEDKKKEVKEFYSKINGKIINFGGKETIGKGFVEVRVIPNDRREN